MPTRSRGAGLATLLLDLLTPEEAAERINVFDVMLRARRLLDATRWLAGQPATAGLAVGYFGASTGAGAALWAAGAPGARVAAVVSRGGRPDLAGPRLGRVTTPTLLVVGERDEAVLRLNQDAQTRLGGKSRLVVVPRGPPTSSRSPVHSIGSPPWRASGSSITSRLPAGADRSLSGAVLAAGGRS